MNLDKAIIDRINDLKIIRPLISSFTIKDAEEIYHLIKKHINDKNANIACEFFNETLSENPEVKILYYYTAVTKLTFQPTDYFGIEQTLEKFFQNLEQNKKNTLIVDVYDLLDKKFNSVLIWKNLAKVLKQNLDNDNSKEKENIRKKLVAILIKIHHVKIDDSNNTELLADLLSKSSDLNEISQAFFYYQIIFEQAIKRNDKSEILRLWKKILDSKTLYKNIDSLEGFEKLLNILNRIISISEKKYKKEIFIQICKKKKVENLSNLSRIFKMALANDVYLPEQLYLLYEKWAKKYQDNPTFPLFLKLSGLKKSINKKTFENINCQKLLREIEDFEKLITLEVNKMVVHRHFDVGVIREINLTSKQPDETNVFLIIDFKSKKKHSMSLRIAINSLEIATPFHLKGLKFFFPDKLFEILNSDNQTLLKSILLTLKEPVSMKQIQSFMVPEIMYKEKWKQRWKQIKNEVFQMKEVKYKNNLFSYNENILINFDSRTNNSLNNKDLFSNSFHTIERLKEKINFIEDFLHQNQEESFKSYVVVVIKKLLNDFVNLDLTSEKDIYLYFPTLLALAKRVNCEIDNKIWDKSQLLLKNYALQESSSPYRLLCESFSVLQHVASRIEFIKNLKMFYSSEEMPEVAVALLNATNSTHKESVLDYLSQNYGESLIKKIVEIIEKEYLTAIDTFILLAKINFDKKAYFSSNNKLQLFNKLIRSLHQCHLNMDMNKDRMGAKKNFNTLYRILFEEGYLFDFLKNDSNINNSERIAILQNLEKKTYLDNNIKREIRTLHTKFNQ